jgi:protoporphyrinogen/coproporphyrinogen III oxidase
MKHVTIVGAGFSGMSLAYFLNQKGCAVTILDKKSQAGGMISTKKTAHGLVESAANGFLNTARVERFLKEINAPYLGSSNESKKRFIFRGKPRRWPFSMSESLSLLGKLLQFLPKKKIEKMAQPRESVVGWADQNFNSAFADYLLAPALQGIYAGDINKLSASLIINPLLTRKKEKKLSSHSLLSGRKGMSDLMNHLKEHLIQKGVKFQMNAELFTTSSVKADHLVIATSSVDAEALLRRLSEDKLWVAQNIANAANDLKASENFLANADILKKIETCPLISVTCFFSEAPQQYQGFGVLFPRQEKIRVLGVLINNVIYQRTLLVEELKHSKHSETWILGGALDKDVVNLSDEEIKSLILRDRARVFSNSQNILDMHITRWPQGLPHYTIEHEKYISELKRMIGVSLHGNYLGSIGLSRILEKSEQLAEKILAEA